MEQDPVIAIDFDGDGKSKVEIYDRTIALIVVAGILIIIALSVWLL
ncbi:hypothetical protein ACFQH6_03570 [Halobacteriaceae archaeon GCM10025711]